MHVYFLLVETVLLGAPYAIEAIPPLLGAGMFWLGVTGLIVYSLWQAWSCRGKMEPFHLIAIGLAGLMLFAGIALAGVTWQRYKPVNTRETQRLTAADIAEIEQSVPTHRHYSRADKDNIADAFHDLRKILDNDAQEMNKDFAKLQHVWFNRRDRPSNQPLDMKAEIDRLMGLRNKASNLSHAIFTDWISAYSAYDSLLNVVVGERRPDPFKEFMEGADRVKQAMEALHRINLKTSDAPHDIAITVSWLLEPISYTNAKASGWVSETKRRISDAEQSILGRE